MRLVILTLATLLCVNFVSSDLSAAPLPPGLGPALDLVSVEFEQAGPTVLVGQNARRQLLVTGVYSSGQRHDLTHSVTWSVDKPEVMTVNQEGLVIPIQDGVATITATEATGRQATISLTAARCTEDLPVNFEN